MTIALILNIVLATVVVSGIVGLLTWSIVTQNGTPGLRVARSRRRRRSVAPARVLGLSVD